MRRNGILLAAWMVLASMGPVLWAQSFVITDVRTEAFTEDQQDAGGDGARDGAFRVDDGFVVTERISGPQSYEAAAVPDFYLVMFKSRSCGPCRSMDAGPIPELQKAGVKVTIQDVADDPPPDSWRVGLLPEIWIVGSDRKERKRFTGYTSAETLLKAIADVRFKESPPAVAKKVQPEPATGPGPDDVGTSHESRETLIEHLLTDSIHKGRHTAASLESLTYQQLSDLHDADHNRSVGKPTNQWTVNSRNNVRTNRRSGRRFRLFGR